MSYSTIDSPLIQKRQLELSKHLNHQLIALGLLKLLPSLQKMQGFKKNIITISLPQNHFTSCHSRKNNRSWKLLVLAVFFPVASKSSIYKKLHLLEVFFHCQKVVSIYLLTGSLFLPRQSLQEIQGCAGYVRNMYSDTITATAPRGAPQLLLNKMKETIRTNTRQTMLCLVPIQ